jgi:hypothetical protein
VAIRTRSSEQLTVTPPRSSATRASFAVPIADVEPSVSKEEAGVAPLLLVNEAENPFHEPVPVMPRKLAARAKSRGDRSVPGCIHMDRATTRRRPAMPASLAGGTRLPPRWYRLNPLDIFSGKVWPSSFTPRARARSAVRPAHLSRRWQSCHIPKPSPVSSLEIGEAT